VPSSNHAAWQKTEKFGEFQEPQRGPALEVSDDEIRMPSSRPLWGDASGCCCSGCSEETVTSVNERETVNEGSVNEG